MIRLKADTLSVSPWLALVASLACVLQLTGCGGTSGSSAAMPTAAAQATSYNQTSDSIAFAADNISTAQAAGSVTVTVTRSGDAASAASVDFATSDGTALAGTDYTTTTGTLSWAENDTTAKTISVPVSRAALFSGSRSFNVVLTNPTGTDVTIGNPGSVVVSISGGATVEAGSVELSTDNYSITQTSGAMLVTVNRTGGAAGAVSVAYATTNGTAVAGTDYTAASGVLEWADGDASSKTFSVTLSAAQAFSGTKTFSVTLSDPRSGVSLGAPGSAVISVQGSKSSSAGTLQLPTSSYSVAQTAGALTVSVNRVGGSSGPLSVAYATSNGTAAAGTDYTATKGTLKWADGDTAAKTFSIAISNSNPFSGSRNFSVALSSPSTRAAIGSPGTATVTINGSATSPSGMLELSSSTYAAAQAAGALTVSVNRAGGTSGAASVVYSTSNGTAVANTDYTAASGTLNWADSDSAAKTFTVRLSNASPFSGTRSFSVTLSSPSGSSLGNPSTASVAITGAATAATGSLQLSASSLTVAQTAATATLTVNRTGGSSGSIGVNFATSNGSAVAGTDYTATSGTLQWADGDGASKSISIPISNATAFTGSKSFTLTLSSPSSGATLSSPSSATVSITGSGGSGSGGSGGSAPAGTVLWIYHNGVFSWPGDYSWNATINYKDTAGGPLTGPYDIAVNITGQWGGFQPYAFPYGGAPLDIRPYRYLEYCTKPTQPNETHGTGFDADNDVPDGTMIQVVAGPNTTRYGPVPAVGVWGCYKIPLADFGLTNPLILKFNITDGTGNVPNLFYVDDVAFSSE
jgi:Calx-beta domain